MRVGRGSDGSQHGVAAVLRRVGHAAAAGAGGHCGEHRLLVRREGTAGGLHALPAGMVSAAVVGVRAGVADVHGLLCLQVYAAVAHTIPRSTERSFEQQKVEMYATAVELND